jgi:hypothetical protein
MLRVTMVTSANSQRLLKSGILLIDPATTAVRQFISLEYNLETFAMKGPEK